MPKKLEERLMKQARLRNYGEERTKAYTYGTMRKQGWKPKREKGPTLRKPGE